MSNVDRLIAYISNDNLVEIDKLKDAAADSFVSTATVTFTLVDSAGSDVTDATSITMSFVTGSEGKYQGTLADTVTLTAGKYTCQITANAGAGLQGYWEAPVRVEVRKA